MKNSGNKSSIKTKSEKRSALLAGRTLKSFNPWLSYVFVLFHPRAVLTNFRCFAVIITEFFFVQFLEKFRILRIPVVHVDHPLDSKIPFRPEKVPIYLDFINLWVRPLNLLVQRCGWWKAGKLTREWMRRFRKLYEHSAEVYHFRLTTTDRPDYNEMREFRQMHALDPHFLCVPSLHVATMAMAFGFYRSVFAKEGFTEEEIGRWQGELYAGAVEITETVLFVKQHSVNCIPAALYLVSSNFPDIFSEDDARKFLDDMFRKNEIPSADADETRSYMAGLFEKFISEGKTSENWFVPVREFLLNYEKNVSDSAAQTNPGT